MAFRKGEKMPREAVKRAGASRQGKVRSPEQAARISLSRLGQSNARKSASGLADPPKPKAAKGTPGR